MFLAFCQFVGQKTSHTASNSTCVMGVCTPGLPLTFFLGCLPSSDRLSGLLFLVMWFRKQSVFDFALNK